MRASIRISILLPALLVGLSGCSWLFGSDSGSAAPPVAPADARAAVRASSQRCDTIPDERTWLNCYYGAA